MSSITAKLKALDIYRKMPKDLTESSTFGGLLTIAAYIGMFTLFFMEMSSFLATSYSTSIEVDHSEDGQFQVNFNLTLPDISCEFLSVDLKNVIGKRLTDIQDKTVHKYSLEGTWVGHATEAPHAEIEHVYEGTNVDHYGNARHAIALTAKTFQQGIDEYEVMIVDFHAPWCSHCRDLAPIYQHAAELVKKAAPKEIDNHHRHSAVLATLDCEEESNIPICMEHHIQAYPTLLVFRQSHNNIVQTSGHRKYLEAYHGPRTAKDISDFTIKVWKEVIAADKDAMPIEGQGTDTDGDGTHESRVYTKGCRIEGFLMAQRVPGQIIIHPKSSGHNLNTGLMSTDHSIHHLSFGKRNFSEFAALRKDKTRLEGPYAESYPYTEQIGKPVVLSDDGCEEDCVGFVSEEPAKNGYNSHEHYIKVVSTTLKPLKSEPVQAYEYTMNSNMYKPDSNIPQIIISFDLSPLQVVITEEAKPWIDGIVSVSALLGGIFSASMIIESFISGVILSVTKKLD